MQTHYLVTGGAGFIGSNIVAALLKKGERVRVADNFSTGKKENIEEFFQNQNFEFMEGDLADMEFARRVVAGVDIVFHQAAVPSVPRSIEDPITSNNANITATLNMLVVARDAKVKKFVYASSSSVYGDNPDLPKQEDFPIRPISPYALQKYAGERYCQLFWNLYGLPTIVLRYFNVFGPNQNPHSQYSAVIPKFISGILERKAPMIHGDGTQSRDFTFVDNVVAVNLLAAEAKEGFGQVFNVACQQQTSLNELVNMLGEIMAVDLKPTYQDARPGDVPHSLADISRAQKTLGYQPIVDMKEGLQKTVEWIKTNETAK